MAHLDEAEGTALRTGELFWQLHTRRTYDALLAHSA
jgi:hypothetical protein